MTTMVEEEVRVGAGGGAGGTGGAADETKEASAVIANGNSSNNLHHNGTPSTEENKDTANGGGGSASLNTVCRDFLRNVCHRGINCKFIHPQDAIHGDLVFCHDFQNIGCNRYDCKFLHGTKEEERRYLETGKLPPNVRIPADTNEPICKDFLKRQCHRGRRCKFRHVDANPPQRDGYSPSPREHPAGYPYFDDGYQDEVGGYGGSPSLGSMRGGGERGVVTSDRYSSGDWSPGGGGPCLKRRRLSQFEEEMYSLERDNRMLRARVDDLQKQVQDLMSTNEFLLQQNAQLRLAKQQAATALPAAAIAADPITSEPVGIVPVSSIITMSSNTTPLVSYPIVSQSLRYSRP